MGSLTGMVAWPVNGAVYGGWADRRPQLLPGIVTGSGVVSVCLQSRVRWNDGG